MLMNGMLVPPANVGDELEPGEPGYQTPTSADSGLITGYLTEEQKNTLREAGRVESCARQQLALLDAAHRMSAAGCMQELRYQIGGMSERDVIGNVLRGVNFDIANKRRALEFERKANPAPTHNKEER